ncbi:MAG: DMT family transporter [Candidatus Hydrogenedentes bacterium]|nr:DMT family transporter [Candidatus Hydrogenedentota bacterium]
MILGFTINRLFPYGCILASALCFSIMSVVGNYLSSYFNWIEIAYFRILPTFVLAVLMSFFYNGKILVVASYSLWYRSIFGTFALLCTFYSLSRLHASEVVTLSATTPIWISLIMIFIFSEKSSTILWLFVMMALVGVYIMEQPQFEKNYVGILVAFLGAIFTGLAMISLSFCGDITPVTVVSHYSLVSFVVLQILFFYIRGVEYTKVLTLLSEHFTLLVILGVTGTLGQILLTLAYGTGKPQWISIVGLSQVVFTAFGEIILGRLNISLNLLIGMFIIIISVVGVIWNRYEKGKCSNFG